MATRTYQSIVSANSGGVHLTDTDTVAGANDTITAYNLLVQFYRGGGLRSQHLDGSVVDSRGSTYTIEESIDAGRDGTCINYGDRDGKQEKGKWNSKYDTFNINTTKVLDLFWSKLINSKVYDLKNNTGTHTYRLQNNGIMKSFLYRGIGGDSTFEFQGDFTGDNNIFIKLTKGFVNYDTYKKIKLYEIIFYGGLPTRICHTNNAQIIFIDLRHSLLEDGASNFTTEAEIKAGKFTVGVNSATTGVIFAKRLYAIAKDAQGNTIPNATMEVKGTSITDKKTTNSEIDHDIPFFKTNATASDWGGLTMSHWTSYVDSSTNKVKFQVRKYGYQYYTQEITTYDGFTGGKIQKAIVLPTDNRISNLVLAAVQAYTGIAIDRANKRITITQSTDLDKLVDFAVAHIMDDFDRTDFVNVNGITADFTDWSIVIDGSNVELSKGTKHEVIKATSITTTNQATISALYISGDYDSFVFVNGETFSLHSSLADAQSNSNAIATSTNGAAYFKSIDYPAGTKLFIRYTAQSIGDITITKGENIVQRDVVSLMEDLKRVVNEQAQAINLIPSNNKSIISILENQKLQIKAQSKTNTDHTKDFRGNKAGADAGHFVLTTGTWDANGYHINFVNNTIVLTIANNVSDVITSFYTDDWGLIGSNAKTNNFTVKVEGKINGVYTRLFADKKLGDLQNTPTFSDALANFVMLENLTDNNTNIDEIRITISVSSQSNALLKIGDITISEYESHIDSRLDFIDSLIKKIDETTTNTNKEVELTKDEVIKKDYSTLIEYGIKDSDSAKFNIDTGTRNGEELTFDASSKTLAWSSNLISTEYIDAIIVSGFSVVGSSVVREAVLEIYLENNNGSTDLIASKTAGDYLGGANQFPNNFGITEYIPSSYGNTGYIKVKFIMRYTSIQGSNNDFKIKVGTISLHKHLTKDITTRHIINAKIVKIGSTDIANLDEMNKPITDQLTAVQTSQGTTHTELASAITKIDQTKQALTN